MKVNPLTQIDFYKADHRRQYPEGTELVYSNFTPRSVKYLPKLEGTDDKIVAFGLQYFIKYFLIDTFNQGFFSKPKEEVIAYYKRRLDNSLGKDTVPIDHIGELHDLGYLPISIRALPEGSCVNEKIPTFSVENTLPQFFWLTNYLESILSAMNWKSSNSATFARKYKKLLTNYAIETGADIAFVQFQGHDFSFRGMSGIQDAVMSGAGHLTSFVGTDTVPAIDFVEDYYNADSDNELVGCSVPATEHSVMCMGAKENEVETFRRLIEDVYPKGIVSIVSDTWDYWTVVTEYTKILKDKIMARDGKVVLRPDSGDPVKIVCGFSEEEKKHLIEENGKFYKLGKYISHKDQFGVEVWGTHEKGEEVPIEVVKGSVECLWEIFGGTETEKGYKVLDSHIGLIYGDSINLERAKQILERLKEKGFASNNIVFGIGSFTYEYQTRDTLGYAMKATAGQVNGEFKEIFKEPKTDDGMKKSAKGYLAVNKNENGDYVLKNQVTRQEMENSELKEVFRDGKLLVEHSLSEIRERINNSL